MNKFIKYTFMGALTLVFAASCSSDQLETSPTESVDASKVQGSADGAMIAMDGIYRSMYTAGWSTTSNTHQCFGISAYNLMADVMGDDCIMASQGSGWFWYDAIYGVKDLYTRSSWRSYDLWNAYYKWAQNANYVINNDSTETPVEGDMKFVVGQAYAVRAYSYFMLAQTFARTYKGHESEPCVPLYTQPTDVKTDGKKRATVAEVYEQIVKDIDKACEYLKDESSSSLYATRKTDKSLVNYYAALGIKARIALTMEDWTNAAAASEEVINNRAYSIVQVKSNDFTKNSSNFINTASNPNVIWGAAIIADQIGGYASLFSHMDADGAKYGQSARKQISKSLYSSMSQTDTRKCWWDPTNKNNKEGGYQQEKFKYQDVSAQTGDYIWMRIEEMYLTAAEAECMLGNDTKAQQILNTFMAYRDTNYNCTKTGTDMGRLTSETTGSLREEIIKQRRIELWGEYGRIYDIRRLHQGFTRSVEDGWPEDPSILLTGRNANDPESYMWVLTIPQSEFDGNKNLDASTDQNPIGDKQ